MISVYDPFCRDFSGVNDVLQPNEASCEESAGGMFELMLVQPMDERGSAKAITDMCIIKAPAPVRDAPAVDPISGETEKVIYGMKVFGFLYRVSFRANGTPYIDEGKTVRSIYSNVEMMQLPNEYPDKLTNYMHVLMLDTGETGYVRLNAVEYNRTEWDEGGGDSYITNPAQSRMQLFRAYRIARDSASRTVTVYARHITYDLDGYLIRDGANYTDVPARDAINRLLSACDRRVEDFRIYCNCDTPITADYTGRTLINALLDPGDGIAVQCCARVIRDDYNLYILKDEVRQRNAEIRYGKNLLSANLDTDTSNLITRIIPESRDGEVTGDPVESPYAADYPITITRRVRYDSVGGGGGTLEPQEVIKERLTQAALDDFETVGKPEVRLDADFLRLELADGYTELANEYSLHMYDAVPVIDPGAGIQALIRMVGYTYDCIMDRYISTKLSPDINGRMEYNN